MILTEQENQDVKEVVKDLIETFQKKIDITSFDLLCSTLDVRSKNLQSVKSHYNELKKTPQSLLKSTIRSECSVVKNVSPDCNSEKDLELELDVDLFEEEIELEKPNKDQLDLEIELYLNEKTDLKCNLTWWKKNDMKFPNISQLAMKYLPVALISQPNEYYDINFIKTALKAATLVDKYKNDIIFTHFNDKFHLG